VFGRLPHGDDTYVVERFRFTLGRSVTPRQPVVLEAERIHASALDGTHTAADSVAYRRNMLYRLEMAAEDGLVMQLHPGVIRNHHRPTLDACGPDTGHDLPAVGAFTTPLTPILRDFGTNPTFRLVLFTVDETVFSREVGPLAGFYPSVFAGAPWWFLDTPSAIMRYRRAITDSAGFVKASGFIDDTRAFCSIPARLRGRPRESVAAQTQTSSTMRLRWGSSRVNLAVASAKVGQ
jgi:Glucuronate isomerase